MSRPLTKSLLTGLICANLALPSVAQPTLTGASSSGFEAENSEASAMTFSAVPGSSGDESLVTIDFCQGAPATDPLVEIKLGPGAFTSVPVGTAVTSITGHEVSYAVTRATPSSVPGCPEAGSLSMAVSVRHDHSPAGAEVWHLRLGGMGAASRYLVSAADIASFTEVQLLPTVFGAAALTDASPSEGDASLTLGGGSAENFWTATAGGPTLSYQWTQTEGPGVTPLPTGDTLEFLPGPSPVPSVATQTTYRFQLEVTSSFPEHGDLVNAEGVTVLVKPFPPKDIMLVLDHSGSMASEDKWNITRQAASLFVDLFRSLRNDDAGATENYDRNRLGHLKFESNGCSVGPATPRPGDGGWTAYDLQLGRPLGFLGGPVNPIDDDYTPPLQPPWGCTPIGDGIDYAKEQLASSIDPHPVHGQRNNPIFVVMSDGMENSGSRTISNVLSQVPAWSPARLQDPTFHTLAVGEAAVEEAGLQSLALLSPDGVYRKATELADQQLQEFFVEILGDIINAQQLAAASSTPSSADFQVNRGETRIAFLLLWNRSAGGPYYPKLSLPGSPWASDINWTSATGMTNVRKSHQVTSTDGFAFMVVDHGAGTPLHGTWTASFADISGNPVTPPAATNPRILAIVDPHLFADFGFDRNVHETGEPIVLQAQIREGADPVLGANVTVELVKPSESEGTFLVENAQRYDPPGKKPRRQGDVLSPRKTMLTGLLSQLNKPGLGKGTDSIRLYDDGAHADGLPGDGLYANVYTATEKDGTYTFRYIAEGTAVSGSPFRRTGIQSNYVGLQIDPGSSPSSVQTIPGTVGGLNQVMVSATPRSAGGDYLGPFRRAQVAFDIQNGVALGDVVSNLDGSYSQIVGYTPGQRAVVTPSVGGKPLAPVVIEARDRTQTTMLLLLLIVLLLLLVLLFLVWRRGSSSP